MTFCDIFSSMIQKREFNSDVSFHCFLLSSSIGSLQLFKDVLERYISPKYLGGELTGRSGRQKHVNKQLLTHSQTIISTLNSCSSRDALLG